MHLTWRSPRRSGLTGWRAFGCGPMRFWMAALRELSSEVYSHRPGGGPLVHRKPARGMHGGTTTVSSAGTLFGGSVSEPIRFVNLRSDRGDTHECPSGVRPRAPGIL